MDDNGGVLHLDPAHVRVGVSCRSWEEALREIGAMFGSDEVVPDFEEALLARERVYPTGLPTEPYGVALPHADPEYVYQPRIAVMTLQDPVEFRLMGDPDSIVQVSLVVALALPDTHKERQASLLSELVARLQDEGWLEKVVKAQSITELLTVWIHSAPSI